MCRFQAAGVGARAPRLFLSVRNIKLSGGDRGRSTDLDVQKRKEEEKSDKRETGAAAKTRWRIRESGQSVEMIMSQTVVTQAINTSDNSRQTNRWIICPLERMSSSIPTV